MKVQARGESVSHADVSSLSWLIGFRGQIKMLEIWFDGLCEQARQGGKRNPGGVATFGYAIYRNHESLKNGYGVIGVGKGMTNNVAEFTALLEALEWLQENKFNDQRIVIRGDSKLVIEQVKGNWKIKSATSRKFVPKIQKLLLGRRAQLFWVSREENREADALSNKACNIYKLMNLRF